MKITKALNAIFIILLCCFYVGNAHAQVSPDESSNFHFKTFTWNDLLEAKSCLHSGDQNQLKEWLSSKGFHPQNADESAFANESVGYQIKIGPSSATLLVESTSAAGFNNELNDFIRQEKWNDELYFDEQADDTQQEITFFNLDKAPVFTAHFDALNAVLTIYK
ncbi:hypothetical protein C8P68_10498 [Mucilaginibacter yixingensis]|uniref:Uncharacterized protein n=1 Tax=Mucilaginibacter yixingensis TaxID=1295612 RepID=A0A2T5J957_9SPHI|nr:hypothetical protein [Mucilaginibacter yixingensis]PTQ96613.1 hypothetical protein C8P68_10498 [Mucilaginibacter yixingensis]